MKTKKKILQHKLQPRELINKITKAKISALVHQISASSYEEQKKYIRKRIKAKKTLFIS